jgi:nucleotide-binding universal stress UspA family protein
MSLQGPLLVPLDGSDLSKRAIPVAAGLARRAGAELRLVHVHSPFPADPIHIAGLPILDEHLRPLRREHEQVYLDRAGRALGAGVPVSTALLDGPVAASLGTYAVHGGVGLIVMATHGRSGLERAWLGSVAEDMVRTSSVPLLLIRPEPGHKPGPFRRILVPLDGSAFAEAILEHAVTLGSVEPDAELILLAVVQPVVSAAWMPGPTLAASLPAEEATRHEEDRAREYLERVVARFDTSGLRLRWRVEIASAVAPAILGVARAERVDAMAVTTHGRSGLARLMLGSVADKLVRGSHTPVLVFRPS